MRVILLSIAIAIAGQTACLAQCFPDRHSTNWFDGWISCESSLPPDGSQEARHWIMYDFGEVYGLGQVTVWNANDPSHLDWGIRDVSIRVSIDGAEWTNTGTYQFPQANGMSTYEGFSGPDLAGVEAQYVLIVAENNWGGSCSGLSEVRIAATETSPSSVDQHTKNDCFEIQAMPNPFTTETSISVKKHCPGQIEYSVIDVLGRQVKGGIVSGDNGESVIRMSFNTLPEGTYFLRMSQDDQIAQLTLLKLGQND